MEALKPQGLLFYQTFTHERVTDQGPSNPSYRLAPNELLELFAPLHVLVTRVRMYGGHQAGYAGCSVAGCAKHYTEKKQAEQTLSHRTFLGPDVLLHMF